jgi:hypothetical protein
VALGSNRESYDDETLRRYLVGELSPHEAERLDELSITDDAIAARLATLEDDLVDAYVRGRLVTQTPTARRKVELAEALLARERRERHRLSDWWPLAAMAATIVAATGTLFFADIHWRQNLHAERAPSNATDLRLSPRAADRRVSGRPKAVAPPIVATFLVAPATRGADITALTIPAAAEVVKLQLPLEADAFPQFEAMLTDLSTDETIWRSPRLDAASVPNGPMVSVTVPARVLLARRYVLVLCGLPASGAPEALSSYPFTVDPR